MKFSLFSNRSEALVMTQSSFTLNASSALILYRTNRVTVPRPSAEQGDTSALARVPFMSSGVVAVIKPPQKVRVCGGSQIKGERRFNNQGRGKNQQSRGIVHFAFSISQTGDFVQKKKHRFLRPPPPLNIIIIKKISESIPSR